MHPKRFKRLMMILGGLGLFALSASLILYALKQNINLYFTPSQLQPQHQHLREIRLGGMVEKASVKHGTDLNVDFKVTDYHKDIAVHYRGILPALFREGQGVVLDGHLDKSGRFIAHRVLAKHDEKYRPPNVEAPPNV